MKSTNKTEVISEEFNKALYFLTILYPYIIKILETYCGSKTDIAFQDEQLNYYYTKILKLIKQMVPTSL